MWTRPWVGRVPRWRPTRALVQARKIFNSQKFLAQIFFAVFKLSWLRSLQSFVIVKSLRQKSMLLCVGAQSVGWLARANTVPNSNLKIWNWYKLLTLWKVVLIDLYALLSNSLYCEHESATFLEARNIFLNLKKMLYRLQNFQTFSVPEFCVNANNYVEGSEGRSRILDVIIFIRPYSKTNKLDSQP